METEVSTTSITKTPRKRAAKVGGQDRNVKGVRAYMTKDGVRFCAQVRATAGRAAISKGSFLTRKEALEWKGTQERGEAKTLPTITMPECFQRYMDWRAAHADPVSEAMRMMYVRLAKHPLLATLRVDQMNFLTITKYCAARKTMDGIHPSTILTEYVRINVAIKGCAKFFGWGNFDPLRDLGRELRKAGLIAESTKRDRRPSGGELDRLIAYFAERRAAGEMEVPMDDIVRINALNGFRRGEVVELRWSNFDKDAHGFYVQRKDPSAKETDGKRRALVPVLPAALEIIQRQPNVEGEDRIFPWTGDHLSDYFTAACKKLGIKNLRLHDLRHEAISTIAQVVGPTEAMMVSGHKTFRHFNRYVNYGKEESKKIATKLAHVQLASATPANVTPLRAAA